MKTNIGSMIGIISIVISLLIAAIVFSILIQTRQQGEIGAKTLTSPIEKARDIDCLARMKKIETAIHLYSIENGMYPRTLDELSTLSAEDLICPKTGRRYDYDSLTGKVVMP